MGKVIFSILYAIKPEKRDDFIALSKEMKEHIADTRKKNYAIYELKGKPNSFTEIFVCNRREEFDQLEDDQDEKTEQLVKRLENYLVDKKMKYTTYFEVE